VSEQTGPEYRRAAAAIKSGIAAGSLSGVLTIPEAQELAGTTYATARKAMEHLATEGILEGMPGKGYRVLITPEQAAASRTDDRPLRDQVAELQQEVAELRKQVGGHAELARVVGRIEANLAALYGQLGREYPRGGRRERAEAAAGGGR
jgi:DNA-binding GntR family transcriptional regulator